MWAEARSGLHEARWRGEISGELAREIFTRLEMAPIRACSPRRLGREAWRIAEQLGWAKTYEAEYVALASLLGCRLVTQDRRLVRGTADLGFVIPLSDV